MNDAAIYSLVMLGIVFGADMVIQVARSRRPPPPCCENCCCCGKRLGARP